MVGRSTDLGCTTITCLVVEDTEIGLDAARALGASTAAVKGTECNLCLGDLNQLAVLLDADGSAQNRCDVCG